ncbi:hypothetical protein ACFFQF_18175 [Haladaptatus pallidirubidus]|uniref:Uncharacterized protein n=1 Tax=Haladaptatus pallidirubidus TaxID=1008152 RepID=A0AAV3UQJ3_9EURY|nr:hypothetical protein [Haladaptatus pallidirubidus]
MTEQTTQTPSQIQEASMQWLTLQRAVAIGMVIVVLIPMVIVLQQVIPPLAVAGVLFGTAFVFTWLRPRAAALAIGVVSVLWLLFQLSNFSQVFSILTLPSETLFFLATLSTLVLPIAGLVGLLGLVMELSDTLAIRTLQATGIVLLCGIAVALLTIV